MSRELTPAVVTAVEATEVRPAAFVFLDLVSGPVRVWSGVGTETFDGNSYTGLGHFGGISEVEESMRPNALGINLSLSGVPSSYVSMALGEPYRNRQVWVWLGFYDGAGSLIADPVQMFAGRINTMALQDSGETSAITITAESRLIDLERPRESRYTNEDQQRLYAGDVSLEYVAGIQLLTLYWGQAQVSQQAPAPSQPFVRRGVP